MQRIAPCISQNHNLISVKVCQGLGFLGYLQYIKIS